MANDEGLKPPAELLEESAEEFFASLRTGGTGTFLFQHPEYFNNNA